MKMGDSPIERLVVVHYHLFPGGVTSSILNGLAVLAGHYEVVIISGHPRNVQALESNLHNAGVNPRIMVDPLFFYKDVPWPDTGSFIAQAGEIAQKLQGMAEGRTLFWCHNPTIGKNPAVTAALKSLAERAEKAKQAAECRFLYHIHDFAECGRPSNLLFLEGCHPGGGVDGLYPSSGNVGFAVLNSADLNRMRACGCPEERSFLLPNIAGSKKDEAGPCVPREEIASTIGTYAYKGLYHFEGYRPWWISPVRTIRRKNVLETIFLSAIRGDTQLLVTLDANSDPEYPYAEAVKDVARREGLPVVIGFGHDLVGKAFSFDDLIRCSEAVATTSLMEGFGFTFMEGPSRGLPVVGRDLPDVTRDFEPAGLARGSLYKRLLVHLPLSARRRLRDQAQAFAEDFGSRTGISRKSIDEFCSEVEGLYSDELVDFGDLDLDEQLSLTGYLKDREFLRELGSISGNAAHPAPHEGCSWEKVERKYGPEAYAKRFTSIIKALFDSQAAHPAPDEMGARLKETFFTPEKHRPLLRS